MNPAETTSGTRSPARDRMFAGIAVFSATSFLSAALLFCLEPMFSKMVLPLLGGASAVWSTAMAVYQGLLLAGYAYAWFITSYFPLRLATLVHLAVLAAAFLFLPIAVSAGFVQPPQAGVSLWLVALFLSSIGLPFFAVAANAPLLQAWFARTGHADASDPYFLYRASNLGSFAVLLAYPFLIEPVWGLTAQARLWTGGYAVLLLGMIASGAFALWMKPQEATSVPIAAHTIAPVRWQRRFEWTALGFVPSGLLIAVTAQISTDVASAPFLWIAPLAIYLLTFVITFTTKPLIRLNWMLAIQPTTIAAVAVLLFWPAVINWGVALLGHLAAFFVAAMICQALLFRSRPPAAALTEFYAWMSFGGVLGGIFTALLAPYIFDTVLEYPLLVLSAFAVRPDAWAALRSSWRKDSAFLLIVLALIVAAYFAAIAIRADLGPKYYATAAVAAVVLLPFLVRAPLRFLGIAAMLFLVTGLMPPGQDTVYRGRSFFGVYKVLSKDEGTYHLLYHGTTSHGAEQMLGSDGKPLRGRPEPMINFYRGSAFTQVIDAKHFTSGLHRVGVVGLGIGELSCYRRAGEAWTYYELDPLDLVVARNRKLFRTLSMCAADVPVVIGDARLTLRDAPPGFDLLVLDAFTSDSIPVHLLTREAFALYRTKLSPHGILLVHISNRNLDLSEVVAGSARANGMVAAMHHARAADNHPPYRLASEVAVVARSAGDLAALHLGPAWTPLSPRPGAETWTDDYSDILGALLRRLAGSSQGGAPPVAKAPRIR